MYSDLVRSIFLTSLSPACPLGPALIILEVELFNYSKRISISFLLTKIRKYLSARFLKYLTVAAEKKGRYTNKKSRIIKKIELITKKIKLNINNLKLNINNLKLNIIELNINNSNRRNYRRSKTVLNQVELFVLTIFLDLIIINT